MPEYDFQDTKTGEHVTMVLPMSEVPSIGEVRVYAGRELKRLFSSGVRTQAHGFEPYASEIPQRWHPKAQRYDGEGRPVFNSRQEVHDFAGKCSDDPKEPHSFDVAKSPNHRPALDGL